MTKIMNERVLRNTQVEAQDSTLPVKRVMVSKAIRNDQPRYWENGGRPRDSEPDYGCKGVTSS